MTATAVLLLMALGSLNYNDSLTTGNSFRDSVDSVEGQKLVDKSFPGGANAPTEVVVRDPAPRPGWRRRSGGPRAWTGVFPVIRGPDGVLLDAILDSDPYDSKTFGVVPRIRAWPTRRAARARSWEAPRRWSTTCARPTSTTPS